MHKANRITAVALFWLCVYVWLKSATFPVGRGGALGPAFFPRLTAAILAVLCVVLFFGREENDMETSQSSPSEKRKMLGAVGSIFLYGVAIQIFGFVLSSSAFCLANFYLLNYEKRIGQKIVIAVGFSLGLALIFQYGFQVPIPHGFLY